MELLLPESRRLENTEVLDLYDVPGPYLRAGMLVSLDGAISHRGRSRPLQRAGDGVVFAALRAVADAVVVGAGTARAEGYREVRLSEPAREWRRRHGRPAQVPVVVVSRSLDLPPDAAWLRDGPAVVVTCPAAPRARLAALQERADVVVTGQDSPDLPAALDALADRGLRRLLCEGGPTLLGDLVHAGLVDELCATISPVLAGGVQGMLPAELPAPVDLQLVHLLREGSTLLGRWRVV